MPILIMNERMERFRSDAMDDSNTDTKHSTTTTESHWIQNPTVSLMNNFLAKARATAESVVSKAADALEGDGPPIVGADATRASNGTPVRQPINSICLLYCCCCYCLYSMLIMLSVSVFFFIGRQRRLSVCLLTTPNAIQRAATPSKPNGPSGKVKVDTAALRGASREQLFEAIQQVCPLNCCCCCCDIFCCNAKRMKLSIARRS
jgi:hypothetical protein